MQNLKNVQQIIEPFEKILAITKSDRDKQRILRMMEELRINSVNNIDVQTLTTKDIFPVIIRGFNLLVNQV